MSHVPILGRELGLQLCEIFGLSMVRSLTLSVPLDEPVTLQVELLVTDDQTQALLILLREFTLTPREPPFGPDRYDPDSHTIGGSPSSLVEPCARCAGHGVYRVVDQQSAQMRWCEDCAGIGWTLEPHSAQKTAPEASDGRRRYD